MSLLALVSLVISGCATPGKETRQTIRVETPGCVQASCELSNNRGHWRVARTPGTAEVTTSGQALEVRCSAEGVQGHRREASTTPPSTATGAITGGVVGGATVGVALGTAALAFIPVLGVLAVGAGIATGAATGAVIESSQNVLRYPDLITVHCSPASVPPVPRAAGAAWGLGVRGMPPAAAREAGIDGSIAVMVTSVLAESAAAAGLRAGDVIVAADGRALVDAADLEERLLALPPGASLDLRVWRNSQWVSVRMTRAAVMP